MSNVSASICVPIPQQIRAIEAEIAAMRARINTRMGDRTYRQNQDADHLICLQAAASTLRHCMRQTRGASA